MSTERYTPDLLRECYYVVSCNTPIQCVETNDNAEAFADAWDRDRREIERLREDNITQRKVNRYLKHKISDLNLAKKSLVEERDRLREALESYVEDYENPEQSVHNGHTYGKAREALAATDVQEAKPDE